jgi:protein-tyrosine phosphatase
MRICFVCLGNLCRSPAAAAVFADLAAAAGLAVTVDSAGTVAAHPGRPAHEHAVAEAARRGITIEHHSRRFTVDDFGRFDLVVALDTARAGDLTALAPDDEARAKIVLLRSFVPGADDLDVADPYGLPAVAYRDMFDDLQVACRALVDHLSVPSAGFEPAHTAPEADALSPELRGREAEG